MVLTRHVPKGIYAKNGENGRRLSNYERRGDGKMAILHVSQGTIPDDVPLGVPVPMQFKLDNKDRVQALRTGITFFCEGHFEELTKKSKIFVISDITIESREATMAYRQKHGLSPTLLMELGAIRMDASGAVEKNNKQDIAKLMFIMADFGIPVGIDIGEKIDAFFSLRAKKMPDTDSVASMVEKTPLVLAEYPDDTGNITYNTMEKVCQSKGIRATSDEMLCVIITSTLQVFARKGYVCWGVNSLFANEKVRSLLNEVCKEKYGLSKWVAGALATTSRSSVMKNYARVVYDPQKPAAYKDEYIAYYSNIMIEEGMSPEDAEKKATTSWNAIYLVKSFFSEYYGARDFASRIRVAEGNAAVNNIEEAISICSQGLNLDETQISAVRSAFSNMTSVIVGAAGTGKTTVVRVIARIAQTSKMNPVILAPSATAAARMSQEAGGIPYSTIHRFVGIMPEDEDLGIDSNLMEKDDISAFAGTKLMIVDEMSMCQLDVFARLLKVMSKHPDVMLVLVGDEAQLPAIGLQFFHQVAAGLIPNLPVTKLETVYRAKDDELAGFCDSLRHGELSFPEGDQTVKFEGNISMDEFLSRNEDILKQRSVMVVSPHARDVKMLNAKIRSLVSPKAPQRITGDLYVGDKVITIINDYADTDEKKACRCKDRDFDVYNGTVGVIDEYDNVAKTVSISLTMADGVIRPTKYTVDEIQTYIMPAYAITVHKAQGAQADNVLLYVGGKFPTNRNMLYTAATRAKKKLVIAGNPEMLEQSVQKKARPGYTKFAFRVKDRLLDTFAPKKKDSNEGIRLL